MNGLIHNQAVGLVDLCDQSFLLVKRFFLTVAPFAMIVCLPTVLSSFWVARLCPEMAKELAPILNGLGKVCSGILTIWFTGALHQATCEAYMGRPFKWKEAMSLALNKWVELLIATVAVAVLAGLGSLLFVIPGIIVMANAAVLFPALFAEKIDFSDAWTRSKELMEGNRLRLIGYYILGSTALALVHQALMALASACVDAATLIVTGSHLHEGVLQSLAETLCHPFYALWIPIFTTLFYFDLRVRKEGADLELESQTIEVYATSPGT